MIRTLRSSLQFTQKRFAHNVVSRTPAAPHTPPNVSTTQAPNRATTWTTTQAARTDAMVGPRFEQTAEAFQPRPLAAIELIKEQPIRIVEGRVAACDGGGGALGHPLIYVNLDKPSENGHGCIYCGLRFKQSEDHHHH
ncbi:hypothetical protein BCR35DRAFT_299790 [Leucosporidium creatinivorum]|uniref:Zinc finger CHCC-type domain-containing protein n=1 Tax=Leucosporidium creatinivorum TaxID=106004 RepID=A0A1Y2G0V4_9BASI|nr:hypothetical protein BCR35DRAFT_299790 [Leucosporidium creatinivorum]